MRMRQYGLLKCHRATTEAFSMNCLHSVPTFAGCFPGADLEGGCRGCAPLPEMTCGFLIQLVFCQKKKELCGLLVLK